MVLSRHRAVLGIPQRDTEQEKEVAVQSRLRADNLAGSDRSDCLQGYRHHGFYSQYLHRLDSQAVKIIKDSQIEARTYEEYVAIPKSEREYYLSFWPTPWYKTPYAMLFSSQCLTDPKAWRSEWDKTHEFLKRNYPIQYRFRDTLENIEHWYRYDFRRGIMRFWHNWIVGQRVEMRKAVFKREYQDLDTIIVNFHMQALIEYVERENPFKYFDFSTGDSDRTFRKELLENYDYASRWRPKYLEDLANASVSSEEYIALELKVDEEDTKVCKWVIDNRQKLWT